ncbi:MAG: ATP-grasp domain-containing protein [Candidatus Eisenbacteria bacterium]|uniref:ATP-grasp domain-containing protein n=1 Tax=Eiseniibacteriota bacterium TaxID=2212470 RepID=A0A7Y2EF51_UNCEI|nr:ATP-grasp domain-containing protein [Candidatus Eisenbacteria bacterium]
MIRKVLVANRGEIAVRVMRSLKELGVASVAVASEADINAPHALAADECVILGPAPASESYLNTKALLKAAKDTGCDALHPGYGFVSENASFTEECEKHGIVFIGPSAESMRVMGSKTASRAAMTDAGVPVVPGFHSEKGSDDELFEKAKEIGWPILLKASAGGGGKGMRVVDKPDAFASSLELCRSEAKVSFGDDTVYLEKYVTNPRHVEIQVFGDFEGNIFALGERECSVQRRHQKIIEESPSPAVDANLRKRMSAAAVEAAKAVAYKNAGTVEFLLDEDGSFYFLEMNTRLQVEHPVTEMVYGVDLVAAQVLTASGKPLTFDPKTLAPRGHAIEARVYAEDPAVGFLPQSGTVALLREPMIPGLRIDSGVAEGSEVGVYYDPMLAKIIAWAETREAATARLRAALEQYVLLGVQTNVNFLIDVLGHPTWESGKLTTGFLGQAFDPWTPPELPLEALALAGHAPSQKSSTHENRSSTQLPTPWQEWGAWRSLTEN